MRCRARWPRSPASWSRRSPRWDRRWPRRSCSRRSRWRSSPSKRPASASCWSASSSVRSRGSRACTSAAAGARRPASSSSSSPSPCAPPACLARRSSGRCRAVLKRLILVRGAEIALFVVLGALPLAVDSPYVLGLLTLLAIYGVVLIGLDVTVGYLGQVNLAQVAMMGLGAYLAGIAATRYGVGIPLAALLSGLLCTVVGALLALPALRLEGPQFALATLSFTALCATALNELEWLTNGAQGLSITRPPLLGHALDARDFFWLCTAILALVWLAMRNLLSSQWGRAFEALRDSPSATDAMGVGTYRHKVAGFAFGSGLGGVAGALYAFNF